MVQVSNAFLTALHNGAPQRWVFVWENGTILTNEDISVEDSVTYDETFCSETDLTVGLTPSAHLSFVMLNGEYQWVDFTFGAFTAYLGVMVTSVANDSQRTNHPVINLTGTTLTVSGNGRLETYELCSFGRFHAERPDVVRKVLINVDAYDNMILFDRDMPSATELNITYPISAGNLLQAMCDYLQVPLESTTFTNSTVTLTAEPKSFKTASMRDVVGWIAELACATAKFNRSGQMKMAWLTPVNASYNEHGYTEFQRTEYLITPVNKLSVRNADQTVETVIEGATTDSPYMIQDNPFLNQQLE